MASRSAYVVACMAALLAFGTASSFASSDPLGVGAARLASAAYCPVDARSAQRRAGAASVRIALHCRCCGRDENGHCNHQCCTD
jgi:hypothetical protein